MILTTQKSYYSPMTSKRTKRPQPKRRGSHNYNPEFLETCKNACRQHGSTDADLAYIMGVSVYDIQNWIKRHSDFAEALKQARYDYGTKKVERSLLETALGFEYEEITESFIEIDGEHFVEKKAQVRDDDGKVHSIIKTVAGTGYKVVHKLARPNPIAQFFWLQNREAELWKNVQRQEVTGKIDHDHSHEISLAEEMANKLDREELETIQSLLTKARQDANGDRSSTGSRKKESKTLHHSKLADSRN